VDVYQTVTHSCVFYYITNYKSVNKLQQHLDYVVIF